MRNLLVAVEEEDLRKLLERSHEVAMDAATMADQDTAGEYWSLMLVRVAGSSSLTSQTQPTYSVQLRLAQFFFGESVQVL